LHDVQPEPHPTPEALDIIIPTLKSRGYEFVTLTELFTLKGVPIDPSVKECITLYRKTIRISNQYNKGG